MGNTVFERNYEIVEKDDRATAVFERAFAPGGFMEMFDQNNGAVALIDLHQGEQFPNTSRAAGADACPAPGVHNF